MLSSAEGADRQSIPKADGGALTMLEQLANDLKR
jgi:hypothetical protein